MHPATASSQRINSRAAVAVVGAQPAGPRRRHYDNDRRPTISGPEALPAELRRRSVVNTEETGNRLRQRRARSQYFTDGRQDSDVQPLCHLLVQCTGPTSHTNSVSLH